MAAPPLSNDGPEATDSTRVIRHRTLMLINF